LRRAGVALVLFVLASQASTGDIRVPEAKGFVNDYAGVIDQGTEARLSALLDELNEKTTAEIAVLTVETTNPYDIFDYALAVADKWKPGQEGKDNGVVFVVAVKDKRLYILTGYGLEGILPDAKVGRIRDSYVTPYFREGNFSAGIFNGTLAMAGVIAEDAGVSLTGAPSPVPRPHSVQPAFNLGNLLWLLFLIFFLLPPFFGRRSRGILPFLFIGGLAGSGRGFGGFGGGGFGGFGGGGFGGGGAGGGW